MKKLYQILSMVLFLGFLGTACKTAQQKSTSAETVKMLQADIEYLARSLVEQLALTMPGSLLVQAGNSAVAEAFIASRLGDSRERNYGTLPRGLDLAPLLARANPLRD